MGCRPLPDWLRHKSSIYSIDTFYDNLCIWRCLVIHDRIMNDKLRPAVRTTKEALRLARIFYENPNLLAKQALRTKITDIAPISKQFRVNLYKPINQTTWKLVTNAIPSRANQPTINIGVYQGHCFYIKTLTHLLIIGNALLANRGFPFILTTLDTLTQAAMEVKPA